MNRKVCYLTMACAGARAYIRGCEAAPPVGCRNKGPDVVAMAELSLASQKLRIFQL